MQKWIDIHEQFPSPENGDLEKHDQILVTGNISNCESDPGIYYDILYPHQIYKDGKIYKNDFSPIKKITHWMPIPIYTGV